MNFTNQILSLGRSVKYKNDLGWNWKLIGKEMKEKELNLAKIKKYILKSQWWIWNAWPNLKVNQELHGREKSKLRVRLVKIYNIRNQGWIYNKWLNLMSKLIQLRTQLKIKSDFKILGNQWLIWNWKDQLIQFRV